MYILNANPRPSCAGNIEEDVKILQSKNLDPKSRLATRVRLQEKLVVQVCPYLSTAYKNRQESDMSEYPVILLVRPSPLKICHRCWQQVASKCSNRS